MGRSWPNQKHQPKGASSHSPESRHWPDSKPVQQWWAASKPAAPYVRCVFRSVIGPNFGKISAMAHGIQFLITVSLRRSSAGPCASLLRLVAPSCTSWMAVMIRHICSGPLRSKVHPGGGATHQLQDISGITAPLLVPATRSSSSSRHWVACGAAANPGSGSPVCVWSSAEFKL